MKKTILNNVKLRKQMSGKGLSTNQMILRHYFLSKNTNDFSDRLVSHFSKEEEKHLHIVSLSKEIQDFVDGVEIILMTKKTTKLTCGNLIKPFNYTLKPFLKETGRGSESLITEASTEDIKELLSLKHKLYCLLGSLY